MPIWEWALTGEAFGADAANEDPDDDGVAFGFAFRFPGQQATAEGLNYNFQRDYDAGVGRYVQSDPIGLEGGINTYQYANGNSLGVTDAAGLAATVIITYNYGYGSHAAVHVKGEGGSFLYDPAGGYPGVTPGVSSRGSGDMFSGADANLGSYIEWQRSSGSLVGAYEIPTTPAEDLQLVLNAEDAGGASPFTCAVMTSSVLQGVGSFQGVNVSATPGALARDLARIPGVSVRSFSPIKFWKR